MSLSDETATPQVSELPQGRRLVGVVAHQSRKVKGDGKAGLPLFQQVLEARIGLSAVPKPANMRMVHSLPRCSVGCTPPYIGYSRRQAEVFLVVGLVDIPEAYRGD